MEVVCRSWLFRRSSSRVSTLYVMVKRLLEKAILTEELPVDLDIEYLTDAVLSLLNAQFFHFLRTERGFATDRISAGLRSLVMQLRRY